MATIRQALAQNFLQHAHALLDSNTLAPDYVANLIGHLDCLRFVRDKEGVQDHLEIINPLRPHWVGLHRCDASNFFYEIINDFDHELTAGGFLAPAWHYSIEVGRGITARCITEWP
ncbi:MAG: hypothetical protein DME65_08980 [Verrucomicrobia bacterium]|nr:MAG: hypothetical protein DME65_08980 [Verrucomicrobiota bacterium]